MEPHTKTFGLVAVDRVILVQTVHSDRETDDFLALAAQHPLVAGVIGWTDLTNPHLVTELDRLQALPGGDKLKGIRHQLQGEDGEGALADPAFLAGLTVLAERRLHFEFIIRADQAAAAARVAGEFAHVNFVVNHLANPDLTGADPDGYARWCADIAALGAQPNVVIKFSGLATKVADIAGDEQRISDAFTVALAAFGADRIMFGSDWPVCLFATTYAGWQQVVARCVAGLSPSEQQAIWHDTAARTYRL